MKKNVEQEDSKLITIKIPKSLYKKFEKRIKGTNFKSVSEYVTFVLREILSGDEEATSKKEVFSKKDEAKIKDRLRSLGYLD